MSGLTIAEKIQRSRNNPLALVTGVIDSIDADGGTNNHVVDASNPFVQLLEVSALCLQASVDEQHSIVRSLYPSLAESKEDVYRHLNDRDKVGIYALPSRTVITLAISEEEILTRAVEIPGTSVKKLTIPPQTRFKANGVEFGIHYPIDIRVLSHGSIRAVWNNDAVTSPIPLSENILDTTERKFKAKGNTVTYFLIDIPVEQFSLESFNASVGANGFKELYRYTDDFYFARVYMSEGTKWIEIPTTFSNTVYDVNTVTAVLEDTNSGMSVSIPQIYFATGSVGKNIRVDIYTTRGKLALSLADMSPDAFELEWRDLDDIEAGRYTTPLYAITSVITRGSDVTKGGRNALSLDGLKDRVGRSSVGGATAFDLTQEVNDLGYDIARRYDNSTSRVYLLSKHLSAISSSNFSTVGVLTDDLPFRFDQLAASGASIKQHLNSTTILPSTLYKGTEEGLVIITPDELINPNTYTQDEVIAKLNELRPVYSPFHYVLENRNEYFNKRCYLLDQPVIDSRNFVDANGSYPYDISMRLVQIKYMEDGYKVALQLKSGDSIKALNDSQVNVQLSFTPVNSARRVYINGELSDAYVDDERVFTFEFGTEFEIDANDVIRVFNFRASQTDTADYSLNLTHKFDVIFTVNGVNKVGEVSPLDSLMALDLLPSDSVVLSHETMNITLGNRLKPLEGRTLTYYEEAQYEKWEEDVPLLRDRPAYRDDASGYIDISVSGDSLVYDKIGDIGDPILDNDGNPKLLHRKGDLKLTNDLPVLIEEGYVARKANIVTFNAMFRYATEGLAKTAVRSKTAELLSYVQGDLLNISKLLPPRTEAQFTPKSNMGILDITEASGQGYRVDAGLSFQVDLFLTDNAYKDVAGHGRIKEQVRNVIIERIKDDIVSSLAIESAIKNTIGNEVITCSVNNFTEEGLQVAAVSDTDRSFSIAPIMTMLSDGKVTPKDDINVNINSMRLDTRY